jgi:type IV pilus assembly protein PilW
MRALSHRISSRRGLTPRAGNLGFGIVEVMVGVVIGLVALLIIYQSLALSEGYRRTTTAGGDAQSTGMISSYLIAQDLGNAGNTLADSAIDLMACDVAADFTSNLRPIPVLIQDGGTDADSDTISVFYGVNRRLITPVSTRPPVHTPGAPFLAQSPMGWAVGHSFVIANSNTLAAPRCEMGRVTNLAGPDANGVVTISHAGVANAYMQPSWIVNLGPSNEVRKIVYDIQNGVLRSTNLLDAVPTPNPIASNVIHLEAQYGIDTNNDNAIDAWVTGRDAPWRPADVLGANNAQLKQIKAVRFAVVVRSSQFERPKDAEGRAAVESKDSPLASDFTTTLFPCNGLAGCTGEVANVTFPNTANYRYRVYEQIVPLRNQIWNP